MNYMSGGKQSQTVWKRLGKTRARRTNTAKRASNMPMQWNFLSNQPVPARKNNKLKQQGDGAGETSRTTNYEFQGTGRATRAPVAQTLQSVRQTCPCTMATCPYRFARFPSCGIFSSTRTIPSETTS